MVNSLRLQKVRFAIVGGLNTLIDFAVFMFLNAIGLNAILANYLSTTTALSFSFFGNKKYTFKSDGNARKELVLFLAVTLFGLWVLQPLVIHGVQQLAFMSGNSATQLLAAKLMATLVSLTWNYILYSQLVFKSNTR